MKSYNEVKSYEKLQRAPKIKTMILVFSKIKIKLEYDYPLVHG